MKRVDVLVDCVGDAEAMLQATAIPDLAISILPNAVDLEIGELHKTIAGASGVITSLATRVDDAFLDAAGPSLEVVSNYAVGYDNICVEACLKRNVIVCNGPPPMTEPTADIAWLLLLGAARRARESMDLATSGEWQGYHPTLLLGHKLVGGTLLVVGAGRIGSAVMRRAAGWNMKVLYTARTEKSHLDGEFVSLADGLARADAVVVCVALTPETRHMFGAHEFASMQPHAVFVNVSRGPVVDEGSLAEAIERSEIFAAGLDVFENEPLIHPKLLKNQRVMLLPHVGSATIEDRTELTQVAVENVAAVLRGQQPPFAILE